MRADPNSDAAPVGRRPHADRERRSEQGELRPCVRAADGSQRRSVQARTDGRTDVGIMDELLTAKCPNPERVQPSAQRLSALVEAGRAQPGPAARARPCPCLVPPHACRKHGGRSDCGAVALDGQRRAQRAGQARRVRAGSVAGLLCGGFRCRGARARAGSCQSRRRRRLRTYGFDRERDVTVLVGDTILDVEAGPGRAVLV